MKYISIDLAKYEAQRRNLDFDEFLNEMIKKEWMTKTQHWIDCIDFYAWIKKNERKGKNVNPSLSSDEIYQDFDKLENQ